MNSSSSLRGRSGRRSSSDSRRHARYPRIPLDGGLDLRARHRADDASRFRTVPEEDQQRNALHAELRRRARVLVDVQLRERDVGALRAPARR